MKHNIFLSLLLTCSSFLGSSIFFLLPDAHAQKTITQRLGGKEALELDHWFFDAQREKMLGNVERSAQLFTRVLDKDPSRTECLFELADIQRGAKRYEEAIILAEAAFSADRKNAWYALFLGELYMSTGKASKAIEVLKISLKENKKNESIYFMLASAYEIQGSYTHATALLSELESLVGSDPELKEMKIDLMLKSNNLSGALNERRKAWEEDKGNIGNGMKYVEMLMVNGKKEEGEAFLLQIHDIFPNDGMTCYMLSEYYRQRRKETEFIEMLKCAFSDAELDIDRKMGVLLSMLKLRPSDTVNRNVEELLAVLKSVHPEEAKTYVIAGDYFLQTGNRRDAERNFLKTIEIDSNRLAVWEELVLLNIEMGRYSKAQELCKRAKELFPVSGSIRLYYGMALARQGKKEEAEKELNEAIKYIKMNPSLSVQLYAELGNVQSGLGKHEDSERSFSQALGISPDNPNVLANYAEVLLNISEQLERAEEMVHKACVLTPNNPYYEDIYARILSLMGKNNEAKEWIERAVRNSLEEAPIITEHYGDILFRSGEKEESLKFWKRALDIGGDADRLNRKIQERSL